MKAHQPLHTGVAVLRPWPFGPPLRGRAPHRDAGMQTAPNASRSPTNAESAAVPAGGLVCAQPQISVL